jgi:hypothetical protein
MTIKILDPAAYRLALAFVEYVEATFKKNGRNSWQWTTLDGEHLTCVEHVVTALLAGELAPLPGKKETQ